jgi:hypothetical protein
MKKPLILFMSLLMFLIPTLVSAAPNETAYSMKRTETITVENEEYTIEVIETGVMRKITTTSKNDEPAVLIQNTKTGEAKLNDEKVDFNDFLIEQEVPEGDFSANYAPAPETGTTWSYYKTIETGVNLLSYSAFIIHALIEAAKSKAAGPGTGLIQPTNIAITMMYGLLANSTTSLAYGKSRIILYRRWYPEVKDYVYQFNNYFYINDKYIGGFTWNAGYGW